MMKLHRERGLSLSGLMLAVAGLTACGSLSAPPADTFYRLAPPPAQTNRAQQGATTTIAFVPPLQADGLHGERALIYVHSDDTTLEQYRYHYWVDSPRTLLQEQVAAALRERLGWQVVTEPAGRVREVRGRIVRFERQRTDDADLARVALHFDVVAADSRIPLLSRDYDASVPLTRDGIPAFVTAINAAVETIIAQLVSDLRQGWPE